MDKIKSITLNNFDIKGQKIEYDFSDFKEVENCTLNRFEINDEIVDKLNEMKNLKMLIINHCVFRNEKKLNNNLEMLIITYSKRVEFKNIENSNKIKELIITNIGNIDINELKAFENLQKLSIFECKINNISEIEKFKNLEELKLDGSQIDDTEKMKLLETKIKLQYNKTYHVGF